MRHLMSMKYESMCYFSFKAGKTPFFAISFGHCHIRFHRELGALGKQININCYTMATVSSGQQVVKGHHEQSDVGCASANVIEAPLSNDHR